VRTPLAAAAAAALCSLALLAPSRVGAAPPWGDPSAPPQERARLLLRAMTLDDKIALLHGAGLLQGSLAAPPGTKPDGSFYVGYIPPNPRLGIPAIKLEDGPAGVGDYMPGVTAFPAPVAAAATWDSALMRRYGAAIGAEELGKGVDVTLAPTVNIVRVPQWGRAFESLGEDPYLAARMAVADIEGIQSTGEIADVKHFAAYNQEVNRMAGGNAVVDDRTLHEIYMPAFAAAITEAGVGSVMCSYNEVNGVQACNNRDLLTTALKREMGLPGFVISDWYGTHDTVQSANAGLDMEMPGGTFFGAALKKAVLAGS